MFNFFKVGFSVQGIRSIKEYFHGDGVIDSNIDIINIEGKLLNSINIIFIANNTVDIGWFVSLR
jgi:hypothetical protein